MFINRCRGYWVFSDRWRLLGSLCKFIGRFEQQNKRLILITHYCTQDDFKLYLSYGKRNANPSKNPNLLRPAPIGWWAVALGHVKIRRLPRPAGGHGVQAGKLQLLFPLGNKHFTQFAADAFVVPLEKIWRMIKSLTFKGLRFNGGKIR
jgi:hypothetical protein